VTLDDFVAYARRKFRRASIGQKRPAERDEIVATCKPQCDGGPCSAYTPSNGCRAKSCPRRGGPTRAGGAFLLYLARGDSAHSRLGLYHDDIYARESADFPRPDMELCRVEARFRGRRFKALGVGPDAGRLARGADGAIHVFENRCAHSWCGSAGPIAAAKEFVCPYHQ